jgi:REP element-mobilizing transposase RayT
VAGAGTEPAQSAQFEAVPVCELPDMARPLRRDYPGAIHHVFVRAVARSLVAVDAEDYAAALLTLERAVARFELGCHAWCYLPNHAHFLMTSRLGNLSRAMHWMGTCTAQTFNRRHERAGHLFQGRFGSRLVEDDDYLLELARYVPLNPVRAQLSSSAEDWPWSSYAATAGQRSAPWFLDTRLFLDLLGSTSAYTAWVASGMLATSLDENGAPAVPERPALSLLLRDPSERALAGAHFRHGYTKAELARHLGVSRDQIRRRLGASS